MKSKTIILSSQKKFLNNSPRAIVTFISNNNTTEGKLRLYNLPTLPPASKLGIYYDEQVYTANLIKKDGAFSFYIHENFNLDNNIYCAIIDKANNNDVVLCGGTTNNFNYYIEENADDAKESESIIETKQVITQDPKEANCDNCANCENCVYKDYFYAHHKKNEGLENKQENKEETYVALESDSIIPNENNNQEDINKNEYNDFRHIDEEEYVNVKVNNFNQNFNAPDNGNNAKQVDTLNKESEKFLQSIVDQLDDMFKTYPDDETIMKIIPNSKVIKVTDTIDQRSYIVGVIYENGEIKYLVYGVPCKYNEPVPKEFGENYQWLPLNTDDPMSDGYYLLYQDATTGKIVPIIVE